MNERLSPMDTTLLLPTRSGIDVLVRPATEADEAALVDFFDRVSDEDRRFRFFSAGAHVNHRQLEPLIHADHYRSESFLGFDAAWTEKGPMIMEINSHPGIKYMQVYKPNMTEPIAGEYFRQKLAAIDALDEAGKKRRNAVVR